MTLQPAELRARLDDMRADLTAGGLDFACVWVVDEQLAVTTRPLRCHPEFPGSGPLPPAARRAVVEWVDGIVAAGFRSVVCLQTTAELAKYGDLGLGHGGLLGYYERRGLCVEQIEWKDPAHFPESRDEAGNVTAQLAARWSDLPQPVLMHCSMAFDRSPAVAAGLAPLIEFRFETPDELAARLRLGREEFAQRLLTSLILHAPYPRWNTRSTPSRRGLEFLRGLYARSFPDADWPGDDLVFVDEFELPARNDDEKGGAPDYAVMWPDRLWLIELKTERGSHRATQIPGYFTLARHHHPDVSLELTYLTPPMEYLFSPQDPADQYGHVRWEDVIRLITEAWPDPTATGQREVVDGLTELIRRLDRPATEWRAGFDTGTETDLVQSALTLARLTAADGRQRALDAPLTSLDELLGLRLAVRQEIASHTADAALRCVEPWCWRASSSGGEPLTSSGAARGFELRLSRGTKPFC